MKNISFLNQSKNLFLAMLVISISCQPEVDSEKQALKERASRNAEKLLATPPQWNQGLALNNAFVSNYEEKIPFGDLDKVQMEIFTKNDRLVRTWKELDAIITPLLADVIGEEGIYSDKEKRETYGVQGLALRMIRDFLIKENPSPEVIERLNYYMDILYRHKAVDLDIITNALIYSKPYIDNDRYFKFREYILYVAVKNLEYVRDNQAKYKKLYEESSGNDKLRYLREGRRMQNLTEEAAYVKGQLGVK
ncbi:MAG TPA: hypothetical protein PK185_14010 [Cyclobacteriaceae bacterium]|nr:hypothetical protein [Cyclobacteriaceae bacterium]HRK55029.1 hypothetical protein [Cyclobacteriaceae bacterium]